MIAVEFGWALSFCWTQAAAWSGVASPGSTSRTSACGLDPLVSIHSVSPRLPTCYGCGGAGGGGGGAGAAGFVGAAAGVPDGADDVAGAAAAVAAGCGAADASLAAVAWPGAGTEISCIPSPIRIEGAACCPGRVYAENAVVWLTLAAGLCVPPVVAALAEPPPTVATAAAAAAATPSMTREFGRRNWSRTCATDRDEGMRNCTDDPLVGSGGARGTQGLCRLTPLGGGRPVRTVTLVQGDTGLGGEPPRAWVRSVTRS